MQVRDMKPGIHYVVTKGRAGLRKGDRITKDKDGALLHMSEGGFWSPDDIGKASLSTVVVDDAWRAKRAAWLTAELEALKAA